MNIDKILEIAKREFQQKLTEFCQSRSVGITKLTPENAEEFASGLRAGLSARPVRLPIRPSSKATTRAPRPF